jgi:calcineurin-like phosphoesterase family protein
VKGTICKLKTKNRRVFICSDPHFGQESFYKPNPTSGSTLRPQFPNSKSCDETIVSNHNSIVPTENSIVYFLGDLAYNVLAMENYISQMNGEIKVLVAGNHDSKFPTFKLLQLFDKVVGACYLGGRQYILTHIPIHPLELRGRINLHGHTHQYSIPNDDRYISFCYEVNNFFPVEITGWL